MTRCDTQRNYEVRAEASISDVEAWQYLVDTGLAWLMPSWFGRMAAALIAAGTIKR